MIDLERELRSLGEAHEMTWGPVEIDDIVTADSPGVGNDAVKLFRNVVSYSSAVAHPDELRAARDLSLVAPRVPAAARANP